MKKQKFSVQKRLKSFKYALEGLRLLWQEEHNARIHVVIAGAAVVLGIWYHISNLEWVAISICILSVLVTEIFNSAIERLADMITLEEDPRIKHIKDLAASAVLLAALCSVVVGFIVFLPKIF